MGRFPRADFPPRPHSNVHFPAHAAPTGAETTRQLLPNDSGSGFSVGTESCYQVSSGPGWRRRRAPQYRARHQPGTRYRGLPRFPRAATITRCPARPSRPPHSPPGDPGTGSAASPAAPHRVSLHQLGTQNSGLPRGVLAFLASRRRFHDAARNAGDGPRLPCSRRHRHRSPPAAAAAATAARTGPQRRPLPRRRHLGLPPPPRPGCGPPRPPPHKQAVVEAGLPLSAGLGTGGGGARGGGTGLWAGLRMRTGSPAGAQSRVLHSCVT